MKPFWTVMGICFLVALSTVTGETFESSIIDFTIDKITKLSDTDVNVDVTVTPGDDVTGISDCTLAILRTDEGSEAEYVTPVLWTDDITGTTTLPFKVKADAMKDGSVTFIIVAHNQDNMPLAYGQAKFDLQVISAQLNWIGAATESTDPKPSLRVKTNVNITVDGQECPKGTTYLLEHPPSNDTIDVCLASTNAGNKSLFCDASITVGEFKGMQDLKSVALIYEKDSNIYIEVNGTYADNSDKLEIVFYNPTNLTYNDNFMCSINGNTDKTCKANAVSAPSVSPFNILFVALDKKGVVTESSSKTRFEDYKTTAEALTDDLMEVSWSVTDFTEYHAFIVPPEGAYSELYVDCDTNPCVVYFMGLDSTTNYVVSVQKKGDDLDIVAATVDMSG